MQLRGKTAEFRLRLSRGETLADLQAGSYHVSLMSFLVKLSRIYNFLLSVSLMTDTQRRLPLYERLQEGSLACGISMFRF